MEYIALNNQSLLDIAIQELGSAEAAFDIAKANNISITDDLQAGQILQIPQLSGDYVRKQTVNYYKVNEIKPATSIGNEVFIYEGIEFWAVEMDFGVS
ncbi:MAG: hypothetical protein LBQ28_09145 [Prevotellaceae bacterium]|jgi:hypothetical protein|nr:hypothetical protein [Prevotellaceae bacterium]